MKLRLLTQNLETDIISAIALDEYTWVRNRHNRLWFEFRQFNIEFRVEKSNDKVNTMYWMYAHPLHSHGMLRKIFTLSCFNEPHDYIRIWRNTDISEKLYDALIVLYDNTVIKSDEQRESKSKQEETDKVRKFRKVIGNG